MSGAPTTPEISVCILAGHGKTQLRGCLSSLAAQLDCPAFELLVGGQLTRELIALVAEYFPDAQLCGVGRRFPGAARNLLIARARGNLLLFLDDDVTAPSDLLRRLADCAAAHPEASVFGGPNVTPKQSSSFQVVQGSVLSSLAGAGPVSRRYGARRACAADERWFTLCNLAVRREAMTPFVRSLSCAEENALLAELRSRGETMRYEPDLRVFHARRATWAGFARQMFKYGGGRGELIRRRPSAARLAHLAPVALLAYAALAVALVAFGAGWAWLVPMFAYVGLIAAASLKISVTLRSLRSIPLALGLMLTVHVWYGVGILRGIASPADAHEDETPLWVSGRSVTVAGIASSPVTSSSAE